MKTSVSRDAVGARIAQRLARHVGEHRYSMWFDRTARFDYHDSARRLEIAVPNAFIADWIGRHFRPQLHEAVTGELGEGVALALQIAPERFSASDLSRARRCSSAAHPSSAAGSGAGTGTNAGTAPTAPQAAGRRGPVLRHALDDFIVGPSNKLAFAAACRLVDDEQAAVSPLFIHGGVGLGKTHLLQGACRRLLDQKPEARVLYTTAEQFTNEFIAAVRGNRIEAFRKRIRRLDLLAVDDVHFLADKQATQQEFLHSFDAIDLGGARLVMASDSHPKLIRKFSEALVSRCVRGMVVQVHEPDTATRIQIVKALAQRRGISLMETVVAVLASRCRGSVREIEGTMAKLHALATLRHDRRTAAHEAGGDNGNGLGSAKDGRAGSAPDGAIGHALVNQLFGAANAAPRHAVQFDTILDVVAQHLAISRQHVLGSGRQRQVVLARSLVVYMARQMTAMSYPEIAAAMGRDSHSSAINATQRIERQLAGGAVVMLAAGTDQTPLGELVDRLKHAVLKAG